MPCNCGKPYILEGAKAAKVVAENPQTPDGEIAKKTCVSRNTVQRARKNPSCPQWPGRI